MLSILMTAQSCQRVIEFVDGPLTNRLRHFGNTAIETGCRLPPLRHPATAAPVAAPPVLPPCLRLLAPLPVPPPATGQTGNSGPAGSRRRFARDVGTSESRIADRQYAASLPQLPPRLTRFEPSLGPSGSVNASEPKSMSSHASTQADSHAGQTNREHSDAVHAADGRACHCSP